MNTSQIDTILRKKCGRLFLGVFAKDRMPNKLPARRPLLLVCNTDPHYQPGEHWIVLYIGANSRGEYFDSYGRPPEKTFKSYLNKFCVDWNYGEAQIQSVLSSFCAHYCVFYCLYKSLHYSLKDILNCFSNDTTLNDWLVHKFVCEAI